MEGFFLSNWFAEALRWVNSFIGNYAFTVILFTVVVKMLLLPLDIKQRKSMHKTAMLKDKVDSIKKRYATDQQKMNQKIQELYKAEGVSMTAGCLPALLQLPIFIALLGAVQSIASEQLVRLMIIENGNPQAIQSFLWVHNMWQPDSGIASIMPDVTTWTNMKASFANMPLLSKTPALLEKANALNYEEAVKPILDKFADFKNGWFILPLLAGGSNLLQTKLTPGMQQTGKLMKYLLPAVSVYICVISSAVFSLYWLTSNVVSIAIQQIIDILNKRKEQKNSPPLIKEA
ncbi:MAG: YidC/Oxa1 family membrane protein insertase [Christensenellales bacterium]